MVCLSCAVSIYRHKKSGHLLTVFRFLYIHKKSGTALLLFRLTRLWYCPCIRTSNTEPTPICMHTYTRIYSVYCKNIHIPRTSKCCNVLDALNLPDSVKPITTRVLTPYYVCSPTPYVRHFLGVDSHCKYKLYHTKKQVIFLKKHHTAHRVYEVLFKMCIALQTSL